jgi:hypothetical protein
MKIKIVGFKVGESRPTANRTLDCGKPPYKDNEEFLKFRDEIGLTLLRVLAVSDFISIRRVYD